MTEAVFVEGNRRGATCRAMRLAHERGLRCRFLVTDPEYYRGLEESPLALCDEVGVVDTYDVGRLLAEINGVDVSAVLAFDDYHLVPAAVTARSRDLPSVSIPGLVRARYKDLTRKTLGKSPGNVPCAVGHVSDPLTDSPVGYPCVVKPVDDGGSFFVRVCANQAELQFAIADISEYRRNARGYALAPRFLVERFIDGPEFSCELLWDSRSMSWKSLGFTRKVTTSPPYAVELAHVFPHRFPPACHDAVEREVLSWLAALGLRGGAAHVEFKLVGDQPVLMEVNPRLSGGLIDTLIERVTGLDVAACYLLFHLGEVGPLLPLPEPAGVAAIRYLVPATAGRVRVRVQRQLPSDVTWHVASGSRTVAGVTNASDRLGYVIVSGREEAEVEVRLAEALEAFEVVPAS